MSVFTYENEVHWISLEEFPLLPPKEILHKSQYLRQIKIKLLWLRRRFPS
jgi:hypothetical protein